MDPQFQSTASQVNTSEPLIEDVTSSVKSYLWKNYKVLIIILLCLSPLILMVSIFIPPLLFGVIILGIFAYSYTYNKIKREFTREFGAAIGFTYTETAGLETVSGKLFETGHSRLILDVLSGMHDNLPMRIFTLRFTVGSGKHSQTYSYTVFEVMLNNKVPDILLFSKAHASVVSDWFSGNETIQLEGDFNQYFKLRVPEGYEQEAYQIFTPDVMVDLIDQAHDFSFEFSNSRLYVYATKVITKREELNAMFGLVTYLDNLFRHNAAGVDIVTHADLHKSGI